MASFNNYYDIVYKTKRGRLMVAKRQEGKTAKEAKSKLKKRMRVSKIKIISSIKL